MIQKFIGLLIKTLINSIKTELYLAYNYTFMHKKDGYISIASIFAALSIMIGAAALIVISSIMNGFHIELRKNAIGISGDVKIYDVERNHNPNLDKYSFIEKTVVTIDGHALAEFSGRSAGTLVKAISKEDLEYKEQVYNGIRAGDWSDFSNNSIAIGVGFAKNLKLKIGDKVRLILPSFSPTLVGAIPRIKDFTVAVIFSSGSYEYDITTVIIPIEIGKKFLHGYNKTIEIYSNNPDKAPYYAAKLRKEIGVYVSDWTVDNPLIKAIEIEKIAMMLIFSLIVIVAGFSVTSSVFMFVKERYQDIAILKTLGCSDWFIFRVFLLLGLWIGIFGTMSGVLIGFAISDHIDSIRVFLEGLGMDIFQPAVYFLYHLPSKTDLSETGFISIGCLLVSIIASIYPARRAAKVNPIEVLRNV